MNAWHQCQTLDPYGGYDRRETQHPRIEALLSAYPRLSADEMEELLRWFQDQASAFDVATVASSPSVAGKYRAFHDAHIEPLTRRELAWSIAIAGALIALLVAVTLLA